MSPDNTKLEVETRQEIDRKLQLAGWVVQDKKRINLFKSLGVAVCEMDAFFKTSAKCPWDARTPGLRIICYSSMARPAALSKPNAVTDFSPWNASCSYVM